MRGEGRHNNRDPIRIIMKIFLLSSPIHILSSPGCPSVQRRILSSLDPLIRTNRPSSLRYWARQQTESVCPSRVVRADPNHNRRTTSNKKKNILFNAIISSIIVSCIAVLFRAL